MATTAATSWPMRSSIGVWLLLALLTIDQTNRAAGIVCECKVNIIHHYSTEDWMTIFGNRSAAPWYHGKGFGDWTDWEDALRQYWVQKFVNPVDIVINQAAEFWPGCDNGRCRIEQNDNSSVWNRMKWIQYGAWEKHFNNPPHAIDDSYRPACVKSHMRFSRRPDHFYVETLQYIGCAIEPPSPIFDWIKLKRGRYIECGKAAVAAKYGHLGFCVLDSMPEIPTTSAATSQSTTSASETASATTTSETNDTTDAITSTTTTPQTTTSGASQRAKDPIVAMAAAILLSLAATHLLPTTIETG